MTLNRETKYGLTFGQMLSLITVFGAIVAVWINMNIRVTQTEIRIENLEKGRIENSNNILRLYQDNREDHKQLGEKLDKIIEYINTKHADE
jgi:uncharacterized protein YgfB (UPF0149 family)